MIYLGRQRPGSTLYIPFESFAGATGAPITITGLALADIRVYRDGSTTERASTSGYVLLDTDGIDFDSLTGIHGFSIDLSDNTTADFWQGGARYIVVVSTITVDGQTMSFLAAQFRIGYESSILDTWLATLASQTSFTLTAGPAEDDALNGCLVVLHDAASAAQQSLGLVADYTGATKTVTLAAAPTFTIAAKDNCSVMLPALQPTVPGRTLGVEASGKATGVVLADAVTLVNGLAANVITATSIAADAITAAKIAPDAIGASELATDAITEIQAGLATPTNITAGTITTVTNLTNAPTAGDLTATMKTSVTTAATAATPIAASVAGAVGSVTGNVGGNVVGSVGSVASFGTLVADIWSAVTRVLTAGTNIALAKGTGVTGFNDLSAAQVTTAATAATPVAASVAGSVGSVAADVGITQAGADKVWSSAARTLTSVGTLIADIWTHATRLLTAGTNIVLAKGVGLTGLNDLSAAQVNAEADTALTDVGLTLVVTGRIDEAISAAKALTAGERDTLTDAIVDQALAGHTTAGTVGGALQSASSAGDPWGTDLPGAYGAGTAGKIVGDNLNATVTSRASQASVDDVPTNAELGTALGTADDAVLAQVALVKTKTDALPSDPADASDIAAAFGVVATALSTVATQASVDDLPTNAELATALGTADDAVLAAIAALNNLSAAQVNAEMLDVLITDTQAELASVPAANASLALKIGWLFLLARNKITQTATTQLVRNDADSATVGTAVVSDDATTFVRSEYT